MSSTIEINENISTVTIGNDTIVDIKEEILSVIEVGVQGPQGIQGLPTMRSLVVEYFEPHNIQAVSDKFDILEVTSDLFPNGVTLNEVRISTIPTSSYSLGVTKMTGPNDSTPITLATVSTSTSDAASQPIDQDVMVGEYIGIELPLTAIDHISIQIILEPKE